MLPLQNITDGLFKLRGNTMHFLFLPRVTRTHYPFLEGLLSLRMPYADWLRLVADWREAGKAQSFTVRYMTVNPHELRRWLPPGTPPASLAQLLQFTDWVGNGRVGDPFASAGVPANLDTSLPKAGRPITEQERSARESRPLTWDLLATSA
ncbi:hypothetical protein [Labrys neptuniae]